MSAIVLQCHTPVTRFWSSEDPSWKITQVGIDQRQCNSGTDGKQLNRPETFQVLDIDKLTWTLQKRPSPIGTIQYSLCCHSHTWYASSALQTCRCNGRKKRRCNLNPKHNDQPVVVTLTYFKGLQFRQIFFATVIQDTKSLFPGPLQLLIFHYSPYTGFWRSYMRLLAADLCLQSFQLQNSIPLTSFQADHPSQSLQARSLHNTFIFIPDMTLSLVRALVTLGLASLAMSAAVDTIPAPMQVVPSCKRMRLSFHGSWVTFMQKLISRNRQHFLYRADRRYLLGYYQPQ